MTEVTREELEIETLRYRAPTVVPLSNLRFAVLCPGWKPEARICGHFELHSILTAYVESNVLEAHQPKRKPAPQQATAEDLEDLLK